MIFKLANFSIQQEGNKIQLFIKFLSNKFQNLNRIEKSSIHPQMC